MSIMDGDRHTWTVMWEILHDTHKLKQYIRHINQDIGVFTSTFITLESETTYNRQLEKEVID
jgi:hypothetical protein